MELVLKNVGIIKDSRIILDGLTVITGKNSSGKTTVGKTMYSLVSAASDLEEAFEESKRVYINSQLTNIEKVLRLRRIAPYRYYRGEQIRGEKQDVLSSLALHSFNRFDNDSLMSFLVNVHDVISSLSISDYKILIQDKRSDYVSERFIDSLYDNIDDWKKQALETCEITIEMVTDKNAFYNYTKDRTVAFLNHEFNNQIKPVKYKGCTPIIELYNQEDCIAGVKVKSNRHMVFKNDSSFIFPYDRCVFIDNPFVIDHLEQYNYIMHFQTRNTDVENAFITSDDIKEHEEILSRYLIDFDKKNYFDDMELQNKYRTVFEKINQIVPGEFIETSDGYFYSDDGSNLSVKNLATGSKMFFIIKKLLLNGLLDKNTMLILDEPESHLHPDWINKFAEILVVLINTIKVNVLLTTHSPNLMLALNVYAKKMSCQDISHFYLAEKMEDGYFSQIKCIDDNIGEGYSHLSLPLVEMNLMSDNITGDRNE